jgi:hypothetical protein
MTPNNETGVPKIHPASREMLPDDPLDLHAVELPGDPQLMLRLLVEEYARMGWNLESIMKLARDPFYRGFHGLWQLLGEQELRRQISTILSRTGVTRVTTVETQAAPQQLVQIELGRVPGDRSR